jgi:transaldolase
VSLEVSPHLANEAEATVGEAARLWAALERPNVMIKVPATDAGVPAIRKLLAAGVNVNVTLLFDVDRYREVAETYVAGLEDRLRAGKPLDRIASVASFFLSRIDSLLDPQLERLEAEGGAAAAAAARTQGEVAVACARRAYAIFKEIFESSRFAALAEAGARPQRLLWASTSAKNPKYSDVKYVEPLIGPHTVNTLPLATLEAYHDHGQPEPRLEDDLEGASRVLDSLSELGIDLRAATEELLADGVRKFADPFDALLAAIDAKREAALGAR